LVYQLFVLYGSHFLLLVTDIKSCARANILRLHQHNGLPFICARERYWKGNHWVLGSDSIHNLRGEPLEDADKTYRLCPKHKQSKRDKSNPCQYQHRALFCYAFMHQCLGINRHSPKQCCTGYDLDETIHSETDKRNAPRNNSSRDSD
jgi:hypothetical protein